MRRPHGLGPLPRNRKAARRPPDLASCHKATKRAVTGAIVPEHRQDQHAPVKRRSPDAPFALHRDLEACRPPEDVFQKALDRAAGPGFEERGQRHATDIKPHKRRQM